jgi:glycosyltransferase involved in cell wall biosynthesis
VPVITSDTSSLPEIIGSAGVLIDPKNIGEIKSAMEKMLLDDGFYQGVKDKCLNQANKFKWQKTAKETLAVYEDIYKN